MYSINVSLSHKQLHLLQDGRVVRSYPVGIGKNNKQGPKPWWSIWSHVDGPQ